MTPLLFANAIASAPFISGPLEPVPARLNDITVVDGTVFAVSDDEVWIRTVEGWVESGLPGGLAIEPASAGGYVVCGPNGLVHYGLDATPLSERPCTDVAAGPDDVWWIRSDDAILRVPGDEIIPLAETTPDAIAPGAWLTGNRLFTAEGSRLVFPGTTDITRIEGPKGPEWLLVHPERSLLGILGVVGLESAWPQPMAFDAVGAGDLDGDGRTDIVLSGPDGWMSLTDDRAAPRPAIPARPGVVTPNAGGTSSPSRPTMRPPPPAPPRRWTRPETTSLLGIRMPNWAGLDPDPDYDAMFTGGFGLAVGSSLGSTQLAVGFSPGAVGGVERGSKRIRSYFGADSAPLFTWIGDFSGIHLAMATGGFTIGSDRLRAGPFASVGLLGIGAGVRAVFTPFESRSGKLTGFEGRLTWFAPQTAHAALYYVSSFPMGRRKHPDFERTPRRSMCHRFGFGLGAAGGFSSTEYAWAFVGREDRFDYSFSPALTLTCDNGGKSGGWTLGGETAPTFFYRVPTGDLGADRRLNHSGSATVGLYAGGDAVRAGPILTAGVWTLGAGFRAIVTPIKTKGGAHHGIELRAVALYPSSPAGQAMALYHVWFDPKAKGKKRASETPPAPTTPPGPPVAPTVRPVTPTVKPVPPQAAEEPSTPAEDRDLAIPAQ